MSATTQKNMGSCPECGADVRFKKPPLLGQVATCRRCHVQLKVIQRAPVMLEWVDDDALYEEWDPKGTARLREKTRRRRDFQHLDDDFR